MDPTLKLAKELISRKSITPSDEGCQELIANRLESINFKIEHMPFGDVKNLWATYGESGPLFVFLGHTDVVPPGPISEWSNDPFIPSEKDGYLYGRGAADMKGSVAAFVTCIEDFISEYEPDIKGRIGVLLTSDEEGPAVNGVVKVVEELNQRKEKISWCLVGEPTANKEIGDIIKIGRRGSIGCKIKILGIQGHIAYPHKAENPIHLAAESVNKLSKLSWEDKTGKFQDSILQISNLNSGTGALNVIPGYLSIDLNVRYSPSTSIEEIIDSVEEVLNKQKLDYEIEWVQGGSPFLNNESVLINSVKDSVKSIIGTSPKKTTDGGTSDGRFIAPTGAEVVELGPVNDSIHKIDEKVKIEELLKLSKIYKSILKNLLT
tara:strand:+ start:94269 stop:95399 length:1131 start_codon:yes stop_codon:yes gene_type:complete